MRMMLTDIFAALVSSQSNEKQIENSWIESHNLIPDIYFDSIEKRDPVMQSGGEIAKRFGVFVKSMKHSAKLSGLSHATSIICDIYFCFVGQRIRLSLSTTFIVGPVAIRS
ncbi:hypothetical protein LF1_35250 [Rubripirellula obstinata]|uniref:Uncharacterized protein n=3 Tax=Rubripirellula obstinata TaxID=406547 RepID=A0A5B1CNQ0_9BACT|nr:hypothetical protein LF1_35250 [Rubripirellula obstinata]